MNRLSLPLLGVGLLGVGLFTATGCADEEVADAYGNFEATEITVSAQAGGRLRSLDIREGRRLAAGEVVGQVDTTRLAAERDALRAQRAGLLANQRALRVQARATRAQIAEADAGAAVVAAQLATARADLARTERLAAAEAATVQQLDTQRGRVDALEAQLEQARTRSGTIEAQATVPSAQAAAVDDQVAAIDAQLRSIQSRIDDAEVANPTAGTVLTQLVEAGEVVQPGAPLYTLADLSVLRLRAYASGGQLPNLTLGMPVDVLVDDGADGIRALAGTVTWIAAEAQFTPTPIQTRDERAELVYAFDVAVANEDGRLKIGMPAEVDFGLRPTPAAATARAAAPE